MVDLTKKIEWNSSTISDYLNKGKGILKDRIFQFPVPKGYEILAEIALKACRRVWESKGIERHANNLPFDMQPIMTITRRHGHGFPRGQALKKVDEAEKMNKEDGLIEILEAITYLMADALILEEEIKNGK